MKVMKFGGSTIKSPKMMIKAGDIIRNEKDKKIIVMSALHKQTNEIRQYISKIRTRRQEIDTFVKKIQNRHMKFADDVISDLDFRREAKSEVNKHIIKMERLLYGVAYTEELTPRTRDLLLSSAERMCVYIMTGVLLDKNVDAKAYEADSLGVITDGVFCNATADLKKTEKNLKKTLTMAIKSNVVPVITGFFGCDKEGRTTTFGKNGSDYSAAVIANSMNAKVLELWKDVDGFLSADPNMIKSAYTIDKLSYDEAAELAYFGIGLLHPRTVGPVRLKDIPIVIKNIQKPRGKGTIIEKKGIRTKDVIKSVVYSEDLIEIKVSGSGAGYRPGILSSVSTLLGNSNINIYSVATSQTQLSLFINKNDLNICQKVLRHGYGGVIESIEYEKDLALVCVVGEGSRGRKGLAAKIFTAVANSNVNVEIISAGASRVASHFVVKKADLRRTVSAIHSAFCEKTS